MSNAVTADVIWLPAGVASAKAGRSARTLARMAAEKKLTVIKTDGGHRRYREDQIEALVLDGAA
jgi:hypothetical protein